MPPNAKDELSSPRRLAGAGIGSEWALGVRIGSGGSAGASSSTGLSTPEIVACRWGENIERLCE